jgi:hypothetical protein
MARRSGYTADNGDNSRIAILHIRYRRLGTHGKARMSANQIRRLNLMGCRAPLTEAPNIRRFDKTGKTNSNNKTPKIRFTNSRSIKQFFRLY